MRPPPPETRSRRHSDPNQLQLSRVTKLTRLTNGFVKDEKVTTRSQAKSSKPKNRLSKALKQKLSPSSKTSDHATSPNNNIQNSSKNKNSSRLNGLNSRGTLVGRLENLEERRLGRESRLGRTLNCNGISHGGKSTGNSSLRATTGNKSQLLFTHHRYQHFEGPDKNGGPKTEKERVALQRAVAAEKRADRAKKRRSALWVLNCEAESFLFGETAADKHEVVLPPLSPPEKRRRIRANELGTLLKETSIIGSKLRSPTPQPSKEQSTTGCSIKSKSDTTTTSSSPRSPHAQKNNSKRLVLDLPGKDLSVNLSVNVDDSRIVHDTLVKNHEILPLEPSAKEDELTSISSPLSSVYSSMGSPNSLSNLDSNSSNSHSVRIQSILTSMDLRFSFEDVPTDEVWYSTFQRQEHPETSALLTQTRSYDYYSYGHSSFSYFLSSSPPALLPYETKLLNQPRSLTRGRLSRLPRKSPRCHASTLAILSSLKRGRNRNSVLLPQSPALPAPSSTATTTPPISCLSSPSSTGSISIASTPVGSSTTSLIPSITISKPTEEESKEKSPSEKSMVTRKLSKNFSKAKSSRIAHHNRLSVLKGGGKNVGSLSPTTSSQNQLTINSCWRLANKSSTLPPVSPPMLSSRPQSPTPSPNTTPDKCPHRIRDISATQYLWDSIQLLSDSYVIQCLSGEKTGKSPTTIMTNTTTTTSTKKSSSANTVKTNNSVNLKSKANQLLLRNSSSKKDEDKDMCKDQDKTGSSSCRRRAEDCTSLATSVVASSLTPSLTLIKNSKLVPSPKTSPKNSINNNVNHNKNYINGVQLSNFPCSHARHCKYKAKVSSCPSPQSPNLAKNAKLNNNNNSNQLHHNNNNNNNKNTSVVKNNNCTSRNGIHSHYPRKSPRKSPVVLVSDIFKGGNMQSDGKTTTLKSADSVTAVLSSDQQHGQQSPNGIVKTGRQEQLLFLLEGIP